jgi:hypothetical protein
MIPGGRLGKTVAGPDKLDEPRGAPGDDGEILDIQMVFAEARVADGFRMKLLVGSLCVSRSRCVELL